MSTYRAPRAASFMAGALLAPEAIAAAVLASHESMQADVGRLLAAQDKVRRLMLGDGDFAAVWRADPEPQDGGPVDVMADAIASMFAFLNTMDTAPDEAVHRYVLRIAEADAEHPFVVHRAILRDACQALGQPAGDWSDVDAAALFAAGPQIGQACTFIASDESVNDGTVTWVHGPTMVNVDFTDAGVLRTASSVQVVPKAEPGARYVCVLR